MTLDRVTQMGSIEFKFDRDMIVPSEEELTRWLGNNSFLVEKFPNNQTNNFTGLELSVTPGTLQDVQKLYFTWHVTKFEKRSMII